MDIVIKHTLKTVLTQKEAVRQSLWEGTRPEYSQNYPGSYVRPRNCPTKIDFGETFDLANCVVFRGDYLPQNRACKLGTIILKIVNCGLCMMLP